MNQDPNPSPNMEWEKELSDELAEIGITDRIDQRAIKGIFEELLESERAKERERIVEDIVAELEERSKETPVFKKYDTYKEGILDAMDYVNYLKGGKEKDTNSSKEE